MLMGAAIANGTMGSAIDTGLSMWGNRKNMAQQHAYDIDMAKINYMANLGLMQYQNCYNQPKNQMKRYVEAGLNPNLIYGQQNLSASPSGNIAHNTARSNFQPVGVSGKMAQAFQMANMVAQNDNLYAQNDNLKAQNDLYTAQKEKTVSETLHTDLENEYNDIRNERFMARQWDGKGGFAAGANNYILKGMDTLGGWIGEGYQKGQDLYDYYTSRIHRRAGLQAEKKNEPVALPPVEVNADRYRSGWIGRQVYKIGDKVNRWKKQGEYRSDYYD